MFDVQLTLVDGRKIRLGYSLCKKAIQELYFDYTYGDKQSPTILSTAIVPAIDKERELVCLFVNA